MGNHELDPSVAQFGVKIQVNACAAKAADGGDKLPRERPLEVNPQDIPWLTAVRPVGVRHAGQEAEEVTRSGEEAPPFRFRESPPSQHPDEQIIHRFSPGHKMPRGLDEVPAVVQLKVVPKHDRPKERYQAR